MTLFMDDSQLPFIVVHFCCLSLVVMEFLTEQNFRKLMAFGNFEKISDLNYACYFKINENQP